VRRIAATAALCWLAAIATAVVAVGCGQTKVSDRDIEYVDARDAVALARGGSGLFGLGSKTALWIDPRPAAAYREAHIPGAIHLPLNELEEQDERLREADILIVYGDDYNAPVALAMTKKLLARGYDDVRTLRGGLRSWKQAGHETEAAE